MVTLLLIPYRNMTIANYELPSFTFKLADCFEAFAAVLAALITLKLLLYIVHMGHKVLLTLFLVALVLANFAFYIKYYRTMTLDGQMLNNLAQKARHWTSYAFRYGKHGYHRN